MQDTGAKVMVNLSQVKRTEHNNNRNQEKQYIFVV